MSYGTVQAEKMTTESGYSLGAGNASSYKNRLINGAMEIDQRSNGAAVTVTNAATSFFGVDRFFANRANGYALSTSTIQQVTDAPAGFVKSVKYTNSTAETPTGSFYSNLQQYIEGFTINDLGWGTANAKPVVLSFWVKISITGTFGGTLRSGNAGASFAFSFSYASANTWQFVSIAIPGPTIGTYDTGNGVGFSVNWDLGVGPNLSISATGAWQATNALGLTSGTKINSTAGATYQLTGCQLEVGTVATSFDYRSYGTELALCQRYCYVCNGATSYYARKPLLGTGTNTAFWYAQYPVPMRATPSTLTAVNVTNATLEGYNYTTNSATGNISNATLTEGDNLVGPVNLTFASNFSSGQVGSWRWIGTPTASFVFSAEL